MKILHLGNLDLLQRKEVIKMHSKNNTRKNTGEEMREYIEEQIRLMKNKDYFVQRSATEALWEAIKTTDISSLIKIIKYIKDDDHYAREEVVWEKDNANLVDSLIGYLDDKNKKVLELFL